jgi:hypothetical protein
VALSSILLWSVAAFLLVGVLRDRRRRRRGDGDLPEPDGADQAVVDRAVARLEDGDQA